MLPWLHAVAESCFVQSGSRSHLSVSLERPEEFYHSDSDDDDDDVEDDDDDEEEEEEDTSGIGDDDSNEDTDDYDDYSTVAEIVPKRMRLRLDRKGSENQWLLRNFDFEDTNVCQQLQAIMSLLGTGTGTTSLRLYRRAGISDSTTGIESITGNICFFLQENASLRFLEFINFKLLLDLVRIYGVVKDHTHLRSLRVSPAGGTPNNIAAVREALLEMLKVDSTILTELDEWLLDKNGKIKYCLVLNRMGRAKARDPGCTKHQLIGLLKDCTNDSGWEMAEHENWRVGMVYGLLHEGMARGWAQW